MANYRTVAELEYMNDVRKIIYQERTKIYQLYQIDLLDNDTMSSLAIWDIVRQYDPNYNVNFARNGEDAISNGVIIEQKCSSIKPNKSGVVGNAVWQFHAMGTLEYPRYIITVRNKATLDPVRLYDISNPESVKAIAGILLDQREQWLEKGKENAVKNMKRDVITLTEKFIVEEFKPAYLNTFNNCQVFKD